MWAVFGGLLTRAKAEGTTARHAGPCAVMFAVTHLLACTLGPATVTPKPADDVAEDAEDVVAPDHAEAPDSARMDAGLDAPADRPMLDGSTDVPRLDAAGEAGGDARADLVAAMDAPSCDRRFAFSPATPGDDAPFDVTVTDTTGYVYVGMQVVGPGVATTTWSGVTGGGPYTWRWRVDGHVAGTYFFRFTADNGAREIATCVRSVVARGGRPDAAVVDVTPMPDASPAPPSANRFGIGLVGPGNPSQLDLAATLVGPGGHVKLIFAGVRPGMTAPTAEWSSAVRDAYARDLVPVIRFSPDWGDRRVRNQSDDGSGLRFTRLAAAYRDIVRGLPLRAGWPLYVEVHNEPNLCYEWQCDAGAFADHRITMDRIAAEYAALVRDVGVALHGIGDARIRVSSGGLAPGGVRWCACVGARDATAGEWEGGSTSLDFIRAMNAAVPMVFASVDAFGSHAYPASGRGYGFFPPYASAGVGLRYYNDELAAVGRTLPVLITETGWSVQRDGGGTNSRDDIAAWTRQAWQDVWLVDPNVRAVMPFMLQDAAWENFAWVSSAGTPYPVYSATRALRCTRIAGRCL